MEYYYKINKYLCNYVFICILPLTTIFIFIPQRLHGQETKRTEASGDTQHKSTSTINNQQSIMYDNSQKFSKPLIINRGNEGVKNREYGKTSDKKVKRLIRKRDFSRVIPHFPILDKNGNIYIASHDGKLSAIDQNGNTRWYIQLANKIDTAFAIGLDDTLYFTSERTLYAINSNGMLKWIFHADNPIDFPPVLDKEENIYIVTTKDNFLYAIRPNGNTYWKAQINGRVSTAPSIAANGSIYITTHDNMIYAINPDGSLRWHRKIFSKQESQKAAESVIKPQPAGMNTVGKLQEQVSLQEPHIYHKKPEEIQFPPHETDKPTTTSFTVSVQKGISPLIVKFSDNSTGRIIDRLWDFGDGTVISEEKCPTHTYTIPGDYDVRLTVRWPDSTSTIIKHRYITVQAPKNNNF